MNPGDRARRKIFALVSIASGNAVQIGGIVAAYFALMGARSARTPGVAVASMILAWVLLYFCSHAIAHWLVGRLVGIRFLFYTVGGTGNPEGWPWGIRWIFERLPFFGVQTDKDSMQSESGSQSLDVVRGGDFLGDCPDVGGIVRMALCCSREWVVFSVCFGVELRNVGEQLDEPDG